MRKKKPLSIVLLVIVALLVWYLENRQTTAPRPSQDRRAEREPGGSPTPKTGAEGDGVIERAFREKRSKVWVEGEGRIVHLLPDDRVGDKHQLFLVDLASGHTIKISHNVDLAPKVPVRKGDRIRFRGRFEYNAKGGVVHWTHHDPRGRKRGGWLEHGGKRYE